MTEYNELTKELLAQGYTAENHPEWAYCRDTYHNGNPLDNFNGGFQYMYWYVAEMVYETPCGIQVLGKNTNSGLSWMGEHYCHENHKVTCRCPKGCPDCKLRGEPFSSMGTGVLIMTCPCTLSDHEYDREGSYEELNRQYEDEKKSKQQEIINNSKGRKCKFHMRWDEKTQKWEHTYDPINCLNAYCFEPVCRITGKPKSKDKGNIYYDIVHEGRDYSKDGTFFEGERFKSILKDNQYFPKPVPLDIAQEIVRMKTKWIEDRAIENDRSFPALTKYRARKGEIDLTIKVENIRAVKKVARDIDDDLEAARQGVRVTYAKDEEEKKKTEKKERREKATADLKNKIKRKIVEAGLKNLNEADKRKAVKILTLTEITSAQREYEKRQIDDKKKPQQLSLFDLTKED